MNGEETQRATIDDLVFDVPALVEYCSTFTILEPGDVIITGTTGGVGAYRKPPLWLRPGDVVEIEVSGVGRAAQFRRAGGRWRNVSAAAGTDPPRSSLAERETKSNCNVSSQHNMDRYSTLNSTSLNRRCSVRPTEPRMRSGTAIGAR